MDQIETHWRAAGEKKYLSQKLEQTLIRPVDFVSKFERAWLYMTAVLIILFFAFLLLSLFGNRTDETPPDIPAEIVDI
jgi:hypothetical protein